MSTKYTFSPELNGNAKPRNFFINIDGTWNDPTDASEAGSGVTNVLRFHKAIQRGENQYSRYFPGVGNEQQNGIFGRIFGGVFGFGANQIRDEAYVVLVTNYRPGDKIFITGFSRGAAIARMLAQLVHEEGIPSEIEYTKDENGRIVDYDSKGNKLCDVDITMLGCWDTVASFGIPVDVLGIPFHEINLFKDFTVAKNVKNAVHLLAVDENRDAFKPTLMNKENRIDEIWFAGVHADVGGGYDRHKIADITLSYMIDSAKKHGALFHIDSEEEISANPSGLGVLHKHKERPGNYKMGQRDICVQVKNKLVQTVKPRIHYTVFERMNNKGSYKPKNIQELKNNYELVGPE
ncbi:MAG: hypothetical protein CMI01_09935 [Oceanospirillaceae bacterium]|nr:hypothetical protein [Oceanospirillaceae bacterium]